MNLGALTPWAAVEGELAYELAFPESTPSNNEIRGMQRFAYKALRQVWCNRVFSAIGGRKPASPIEYSFLVITRECSGGGLDWDNVYGGLKPLLDCLVCVSKRNPSGLGLIRDDSPKSMPFPPFIRQLDAKKGEDRTTVQIYSLERPQAASAGQPRTIATSINQGANPLLIPEPV